MTAASVFETLCSLGRKRHGGWATVELREIGRVVGVEVEDDE